MTGDRVIGSVVALALGDAFGAPHEGGPLERLAWALLGRRGGKRRWTDDTCMTLDVIESLTACGDVDQDDLARRFAASYRWSRGYGPGAAKVLKRVRRGESWAKARFAAHREGSFGNGGAMRAPAIGLFFAEAEEARLVDAAMDCAAVTHAHPLGKEGAALIALATARTLQGAGTFEILEKLRGHATTGPFPEQLDLAQSWLREGRDAGPTQVATELGNGVAASRSCVTAIYLALRFREDSFDSLLDFAIRVGGDVDTIASMACAIQGAARGLEALPLERLDRLEELDRVLAAARSLAESAAHRHP